MKHLSDLRKEASSRSKQAQYRAAKYYDAKHIDVTYNVGDKVCRLNHVISSAAQRIAAKLTPKFIGPYIIDKQVGFNVYELRDQDNASIDPFYVKQLKPFVERTENKERQQKNMTSQPPMEDNEPTRSDPSKEGSEPAASTKALDKASRSSINSASNKMCENNNNTVLNNVSDTIVKAKKRKQGRPRKTITVFGGETPLAVDTLETGSKARKRTQCTAKAFVRYLALYESNA